MSTQPEPISYSGRALWTSAVNALGGVGLLLLLGCGPGTHRLPPDSLTVEDSGPPSCTAGGRERLRALDSLWVVIGAHAMLRPSEVGWSGLDQDTDREIREMEIQCKDEAIAQLIVSPERITSSVAMDLARLYRAGNGSAAALLAAVEQQGRPERLLDALQALPKLQNPADREFVRALVAREVRAAYARWHGDSVERVRRLQLSEEVTLSHVVVAAFDVLAPPDIAMLDSLLHAVGMEDMRPGS